MSNPQTAGLALWRERQAAEKRRQVAELDRLREESTTEERDGRTYTVVHIPDRYDFKPLRVERAP